MTSFPPMGQEEGLDATWCGVSMSRFLKCKMKWMDKGQNKQLRISKGIVEHCKQKNQNTHD
jgi:hypothetical protein